uniref:Uncharacterized protein n=1 Tax=Rhizophora mucronata TaxID=61149 RepID=A0A2P2P4S8_RHIMU
MFMSPVSFQVTNLKHNEPTKFLSQRRKIIKFTIDKRNEMNAHF